MRLYPDLIPHNSFHKGIWLSTKNTPWYYFLTTQREHSLPENPNFYFSVDNVLKPIVHLLHRNNIPTTPSCSGHYFNKEHYIPTYNSLLTNQKVINDKGIILKDDESNKNYFYQNKNYKLPWNLESFLDKIYTYQTKGVIGLKDKDKTFFNNLPKQNYEVERDGDITIILTNSKNKKDCNEIWNLIHNNLSDIIQK